METEEGAHDLQLACDESWKESFCATSTNMGNGDSACCCHGTEEGSCVNYHAVCTQSWKLVRYNTKQNFS